MATFTSKEFNQRASQALKIAEIEPVYITKWGKIVSVLTNIQTFQSAQNQEASFEHLFGGYSVVNEISDEFNALFDEELRHIRQNTGLRAVDFSEE